MNASSRMTKDQLRDALADVGIKTATKLKKAELVKLYREKVLEQNVSTLSPNDSIIGGFSSDEEEPLSLDTSHITSASNVKQLTNDEIFFKLKDLGEHVGPILDSTRTIYERKLIRLLGGDEAVNIDHIDRNISSFSADEEEEKELDKDETDEYDVVGVTDDNNEEIRTVDFSEKILDNGGYLKTSSNIHEKFEENDGNIIRTRRTHTVKTFDMSETHSTNGKSFVPPPPKKESFPMVARIAVIVVLLIAVLVWFNLEAGKQFNAVPTGGKAPEAVRISSPGGVPVKDATSGAAN